MIVGVIILVSIFASFPNCPIKSIAWDNVTDEYETFLKIKDVKEVDELFNILKDEKVSIIQIKDGTFKIYNDQILIDIADNKVNKISSNTMQAIYDMEKVNTKNVSIKYDGDVEILCYTDDKGNDVVRVGNNEYWAYKAGIFPLGLAISFLICGLIETLTTFLCNND